MVIRIYRLKLGDLECALLSEIIPVVFMVISGFVWLPEAVHGQEESDH